MRGQNTANPFAPLVPECFLNTLRPLALFDLRGATSSVTKVNEAAKTADVTLIFNGTPAQDPRRKRLGEQP
mgnify:CR=1 FL=1